MRRPKRCCDFAILDGLPGACGSRYHPSVRPRLAVSVVLTAVGLPLGLARAQPNPPETQRVEVVCDGSRRAPASMAEPLRHELERRLAALEQLVGFVLPSAAPRCRVEVFGDELAARAATRTMPGRELVGCGALDRATGRIVVLRSPDLDVARPVAVAAVVWWVEQRMAPVDLRGLGGEWLAHGLAHLLVARAGEPCDTFLVRGGLFAPVRCHAGQFEAAAAGMARDGTLPALSALLQTAGDDLDFDQLATATAFVAWLERTGHEAQTGPAAVRRSLLQRLVDALRAGDPAAAALPALFGVDLAEIERRFRSDLVAAAGDAGSKGKAKSAGPRPTHPHAAIFVYGREPVPARHRKVVAAALAARAGSLTSAFRTVDGAPLLQLGPVDHGVNFWRRGRMGKAIDQAWPFVVVLEYALDGRPEAFLDCFRRAAGSPGDGGWMLDPNLDFVLHHNAQIATDQDERFGYLAIPDTPTGTHVGGTEFVHRGRIRWADGRQAHLGVATRLAPVRTGPAERWAFEQRWLVDWCVTEWSRASGAVACGPLDDPTRQLAIWGTARVLDFPEIPPGMRAGRGRD